MALNDCAVDLASWPEEWNTNVKSKLFEIGPTLLESLPSVGGNKTKCGLQVTSKLDTRILLTHFKKRKRTTVQFMKASKTYTGYCKYFTKIRNKHYTTEVLRTLFRDVSPWSILEFMKETGLFKHI